MQKNNTKAKAREKNFFIRGAIGALFAFLAMLLILPLLLLRTSDPSAFAGAGSIVCIASAALCGAYFYSKGNPQNKLLALLVCGGTLCLVLTAISLAFGKGEEEISPLFSSFAYGVALLFSALGVYLSRKAKKKKRKR